MVVVVREDLVDVVRIVVVLSVKAQLSVVVTAPEEWASTDKPLHESWLGPTESKMPKQSDAASHAVKQKHRKLLIAPGPVLFVCSWKTRCSAAKPFE